MMMRLFYVGLLICLATLVTAFIAKNDKPTLYIIGDSTVKNGRGDGSNGQWGWGSFLHLQMDTAKINVRNKALGGTSSRTFYNDPKLWQPVLDSIRAGDFVIMQFGHNDASPIVDTLRARGSIRGNGDEFNEVDNPLLKQREIVYSYGFYLRRFVKNIQDKGAYAIICSPIPRNAWEGDKVRRSDYSTWAEEAAKQSGAFFIPLQDMIIAAYEERGKNFVNDRFFEAKDHTHTTREGAGLNASLVARFLAGNPESGLRRFCTTGIR